MIEPITIVIPGKPIPKARPRFTGNRCYTPAKTSSYELLIRLLANREMAGKQKLDGPLQMTMKAHFAIPASWSKSKRAEALLGNISPAGGDTDNIVKSVADGLQKIVFNDDKQIVKIAASKAFTNGEPFVVVTVQPIEPVAAAFQQIMESAGLG
jgi:Holliday junction resolvase RusA-like endonuclease